MKNLDKDLRDILCYVFDAPLNSTRVDDAILNIKGVFIDIKEEIYKQAWKDGDKHGRLNKLHVISHDVMDNEDIAGLRPILIKRLKNRKDNLMKENS